MRSSENVFIFLFVIVLFLLAAGCTQPAPTTPATAATPQTPAAVPSATGTVAPVPSASQPVTLGSSMVAGKPLPVVYIVYGSEKGDLSYTDAAYSGIVSAQKERNFTVREFTPGDYQTLPVVLNSTTGPEKPGLVITVGFQYADFTRALAAQHPDIRFLGIDQAGNGTSNLNVYEITSYGDSYLAGTLASSATKSGRVGIIMGMKTPLLDTFIDGYTDGAKAANASVVVGRAYVHENSVDGFTDPVKAGRIAEGMYRNGTDVIFVGAGISNTGVFDAAKNGTGRYAIGTDSDQSHLGPSVVLASAVKRVDRVVHDSIVAFEDGKFKGGNHVAGLKEGATGIVFNTKFESFNATVSAKEAQAESEEQKYLAARA